jgi:hypothetical protein
MLSMSAFVSASEAAAVSAAAPADGEGAEPNRPGPARSPRAGARQARSGDGGQERGFVCGHVLYLPAYGWMHVCSIDSANAPLILFQTAGIGKSSDKSEICFSFIRLFQAGFSRRLYTADAIS